MPPGPNERQLHSNSATGIQNGVAISVAIFCAALGVIAWFPGLDQRLLDRTLPDTLKWFPALAVVTLILYFVLASRQCEVYLTPHGLRIVRGKTEIAVPMSQIKTVERRVVTSADGNRSRDNTIIITFRDPTPLGASIQFLAPLLHTQSLVDELRRRAGFLSSQ
jgi:hypothetical protein